jgi:hypothetical protein
MSKDKTLVYEDHFMDDASPRIRKNKNRGVNKTEVFKPISYRDYDKSMRRRMKKYGLGYSIVSGRVTLAKGIEYYTTVGKMTTLYSGYRIFESEESGPVLFKEIKERGRPFDQGDKIKLVPMMGLKIKSDSGYRLIRSLVDLVDRRI